MAKTIEAKRLRKGMVVVSSGELKMRILEVQPYTMTITELTVEVLASRKPKATSMHGKTYTYQVPATMPFRRMKKVRT